MGPPDAHFATGYLSRRLEQANLSFVLGHRRAGQTSRKENGVAHVSISKWTFEIWANGCRWVDSDIIILNDEIPVEIFLPPSDMKDIHLVASRDQNGLDSGVMFLHVHPWTVSLLTEIMAYPLYLPGIDLGQSADPEGMGRVLNKTTGGPSGKGYTDGVVYLPKPWINAYQRDMVYEGNKGDLLVHFPELEKRQWQYMAKWLDATENMPHEWDVSLQETGYLDRTTIYWSLLRRARNTVESLEKKMQSGGSLPGRPMEKIANFKKVLRENSDDMELIQTQLNALDALFG